MAKKDQNNDLLQKVATPKRIVFNIIKKPISIFMGLSRRGKIIVIIVIALIGFWRIQAYRNSGLKVEVSKVIKGNLVESVSASGEVSATEAANLTFQTAGTLQKINVQAGDNVNKNQILAQLNLTSLNSAYQEANANLRAAEATLAHTYDQIQGHNTDETFAQRDTRTSAETSKDYYYWAFVAAKHNLEGAIVKSPFNGIVTIVPTNLLPGSFISSPSQATFQVVNPKTIYFRADIDELDVPKVKVGQKVKVQLDAYPDQTYDGAVINIEYGSVITSTGGTAYRIKVSMPDNNGLKFRLGMNGNAEIIKDTKTDVLMIPQTAIVETNGKSYVYLVTPDKTAKLHEVNTGSSSINDIEITSGLSGGETIITQPPSNIKNGERLKLDSFN